MPIIIHTYGKHICTRATDDNSYIIATSTRDSDAGWPSTANIWMSNPSLTVTEAGYTCMEILHTRSMMRPDNNVLALDRTRTACNRRDLFKAGLLIWWALSWPHHNSNIWNPNVHMQSPLLLAASQVVSISPSRIHACTWLLVALALHATVLHALCAYARWPWATQLCTCMMHASRPIFSCTLTGGGLRFSYCFSTQYACMVSTNSFGYYLYCIYIKEKWIHIHFLSLIF